MILSSFIVKASFSGSLTKFGATSMAIYGARIIPRRHIRITTDNKKPKTTPASLLAASLPSFAIYSVKTGTYPADTEPSAKSSLRRLGIRYATKNASVSPEAPKTLAIITSLTKPRIRLHVVAIDIRPAAFVTLRFSSIQVDFPIPIMLKNSLL